MLLILASRYLFIEIKYKTVTHLKSIKAASFLYSTNNRLWVFKSNIEIVKALSDAKFSKKNWKLLSCITT